MQFHTTPGSDSEEGRPDTLAYSRFVPERMDDYASEKDKVAFRPYGPAE